MALAEPARQPPAPEERGVDPQLAGALNSLLGALDRLPANEVDEEARLQAWLPYDRGRVSCLRKGPGVLRWFGPLLHRESFGRDASKGSGLKSICKECDRAKARAYYEREK